MPDISVLRSMGQVLSLGDVAEDTFHSFMPTYQVCLSHIRIRIDIYLKNIYNDTTKSVS